ncbi:hypothetical protein Mgra_00006138 [Meloidogyne graminicola]|uniref:SH3 domain-containing protein n=1 Tax=Meloidogyne graminicola TaxID=189291 RepID=A0A8S9ZLZ6_9BILA|nr:hypothetical protein Mgra_00006138 [Meloidogyne graminicola]
MTRIELFAHKSKKVNSILNQLSSDFHPALKNVSHAGQNLLRAFQNFNRNHYQYTASLYALAFSSSTAEQDVRECTKQLERITDVMKSIYSSQSEWMDYFTEMTNIITGNCENEKERLKALKDGFLKREKKLNKQVNNGKKMTSDLENFYEMEMILAKEHQSQRYQFFIEKHSKLLKLFFEWTRNSTILLEKEFKFGIKINSNKSNDLTKSNSVVYDINSPDSSEPMEKINHQNQRVNTSQKQQNGSRRLPVLDENKTVDFEERSLITPTIGHQGIFRPIPILPKNQQKFRHSLVEYSNNLNNSNDLIVHNEKTKEETSQQLQKFYREGPSRSEDFGQKIESPAGVKRTFSPLQNSQENFSHTRPFVSSVAINNPPAFKRNDPNLTYHYSRAQSAESMTNSSIARLTPPIFSLSDYNRLLECVTPYEAQGDNKSSQLSLSPGERIFLVKSGTRGWVLGRSEDGSRQGWFPAKYLKLV